MDLTVFIQKIGIEIDKEIFSIPVSNLIGHHECSRDTLMFSVNLRRNVRRNSESFSRLKRIYLKGKPHYIFAEELVMLD